MEDVSVEELAHASTPLDDELADMTALNQDFPDSPTESPEPGATSADANAKPSAPLQKRRRVTRACDECRRKKIKCDGKLPCTHCTVYSYECTYDQPSNRRRNATPQHIEALEQRLKRAEALLRLVIPNVDLNDPNLESNLQNGQIPLLPGAAVDGSLPSNSPVDTSEERHSLVPDNSIDAELESMVRTTGQLDIDEQGNWDYRGHSSGLTFVRRMREQLGDIIAQPRGNVFVKPPPKPSQPVQDSPKSNTLDSPSESAFQVDLPTRDVAKELCRLAIDEAAALMRVTHSPTFFAALDRIYDISPENYTHEENSFLPLLYAMLALGTLFTRDSDPRGYKSAIDEGYKYFRMCRQILDVAECRNLTSLQAIVYMIMFLQSSAKLSTCYSYIGIALRSALRMGLHRNLPATFTPIEAECRKRTFWVIRKMDIYVGALLGLPYALSDDDIDQELPIEVDDEYITETSVLKMPEGHVSIMTASNAHTRLIDILGKVVKYIYPVKSKTSLDNVLKNYTVSYWKIREIENDLQEWMEKLPMGLKPGGEAPPIIIRVQQLLRMAYAHTQVMLYRPFLHYVSQTQKTKPVDKRSYACAATCVSVSRNIIHIAMEMKRQSLLIGAYWFTMYTTFFAILSLVFFVLENSDNPASPDLLRDVFNGKDTLEQLAKRSMAADRCSATLRSLFDRLPEHLKRRQSINGVQNHVNRKRRSEHIQNSALPADTFDTNSNTAPRRSSNFPDAGPNLNQNTSFYAQMTPQQVVHETHSYSPVKQEFMSQPTTFNSPPLSNTTYGFSGQPQPTRRNTMSSDPIDYMAEPPLIKDVSALMFPSTDPFAYPAQPLTAYDTNFWQNMNYQNQQPRSQVQPPTQSDQHQRQQAHNPIPTYLSLSPTQNTHNNQTKSPEPVLNGDVDMQLLGPVPMYMAQATQFPAQGARPQPQPLDGMNGGAVNLDELFGGDEWAGMFSDYGQWGQLEMGYAGPAG